MFFFIPKCVEHNILQILANGDNPLVALQAFIILVLAGVVVKQWHYTVKETVPYPIHKELSSQSDKLIQAYRDDSRALKEKVEKHLAVCERRLT